MLSDHPNQPFVRSVMQGLREGFWPLDEGEWKLEIEDKVENYPCDDIDLDSICAFRDHEIAAEQWSHLVSCLIPGMKVSPYSSSGNTQSLESSLIIVHPVSMMGFQETMLKLSMMI
jgi:hypothetical protein